MGLMFSKLNLTLFCGCGPAVVWVQVLSEKGVSAQGKLLSTKWIALKCPCIAQVIFTYT